MRLDVMKKIEAILMERSCLNRRLLLELKFRSTPLRIGSAGREERGGGFLQLLKVSTDKGYLPIIPESSWRGVLRRIGEWIAKASAPAFQDELERRLVSLHQEGESLNHAIKSGQEDFAEEFINEILREAERSEDSFKRLISRDMIRKLREEPRTIKWDEEGLQPLFSLLCPLCRLFGGPGIRGKLILQDTQLGDGALWAESHVAINRLAGVREEEHLFRVESFLPSELILSIIVDNLGPGDSEALILSGLLDWILKLGLEIGGFRSRGLGHLELRTEASHGIFLDLRSMKGGDLARALAQPMQVGKMKSIEELVQLLRNR